MFCQNDKYTNNDDDDDAANSCDILYIHIYILVMEYKVHSAHLNTYAM